MKIMCYGSFIDYQIEMSNSLSETNTIKLYFLSNNLYNVSTELINKKVDFKFLGNGKNLYHPANLITIRDFINDIKKFDPDVIHLQAVGTIPDLIFLPFFKKYPLVTTFHDVTLHLGEKSIIQDFVRQRLRKCSDQIIVHGVKLKEQMITKYNVPGELVNSITIGEHESKQFLKYINNDLKEDGNLILFFGRIYEYKGLEYLIKAEPLITKEIPDSKIVIAGVGEDFVKYEKMMVNRDNFIVHNYRIPYKEGAELFQRCSVVVLPYIEASQSGVIPTAYSFKKPVVVTDVGSIPEIVDEEITGFVVPPKDSESLAEAIITLLNDKELRRKMGINSYKKLKTDLSWGNIAEKTIDVYNKAIERHIK